MKNCELMTWIIVILLACTVGLMLVGGILDFVWQFLCFILSIIISWIFPDGDW